MAVYLPPGFPYFTPPPPRWAPSSPPPPPPPHHVTSPRSSGDNSPASPGGVIAGVAMISPSGPSCSCSPSCAASAKGTATAAPMPRPTPRRRMQPSPCGRGRQRHLYCRRPHGTTGTRSSTICAGETAAATARGEPARRRASRRSRTTGRCGTT